MAPLESGGLSQRGTYNGNPLSAAAAIACLDYLAEHADQCFPRMDRYAMAIAEHVRDTARRVGTAVTANCVGPCVQLFGGVTDVATLQALPNVSKEQTLCLTELLVRRGVATIPRGLMYVSTAHTDADIDTTLQALSTSIEALARDPRFI